eukprot:403346260
MESLLTSISEEQTPSTQRFTEEEQKQILKQTKDVLSKVEATLKKNEESKRDMLLMEKASVSLDQKWQEFQDSFNRMNQALVKNIARSMGIKAKDIPNLHERKPKEPKHLPQQINIEIATQKLREGKKVLVIQGSQGVNQIGDKSMFTLKNLNENLITVWKACRSLIQEIQSNQSNQEIIDILNLIDEQSMFLSNSIFDNTRQRSNKIHLNGLVNEMKCLNKQCSQFNRGKPIEFNNLDVPQIKQEESKVQQTANQTLQVNQITSPQNQQSKLSQQRNVNQPKLGLLSDNRSDGSEMPYNILGNNQLNFCNKVQQSHTQQKTPAKTQPIKRSQQITKKQTPPLQQIIEKPLPLVNKQLPICEQCSLNLRPSILMNDELTNSSNLNLQEIIKYSGSADLIVFIGQPLKENFMCQSIAQRAIKGQTTLIEVLAGEEQSQFTEGLIFTFQQ